MNPQQQAPLRDTADEQFGGNVVELDETTPMHTATTPSPLESPLEPSIDDGAERQMNTGVAQVSHPPAFAVIATAYDPHSQNPRYVIEFEHGTGRRVRRLLPVHVITSNKRARDALIKVGVPSSVASAATTLAALVNDAPSATGLYDVPLGWMKGCDVGMIYRYGDTAYSSSGPITVYADGSVPEPQQSGDANKLTEASLADRSPGTAILIAAHFASPLVHLLGYRPFVIVASGVPPCEVERLATLADFAFGTKATALHARRKDTDDALVHFVSAKSRKQAFAHAQTLLEAGATGKSRGNRIGRAHVPVSLIVTTETDSPGNLASSALPPGCIEIHLDALSSDAPKEAVQASSDAAVCCEISAAKAYVEAVLRKQDTVVRNADTNLPSFVERYWSMVKAQQSSVDVPTAVHSFALMRYALKCGRQLHVLPPRKEAAEEVMDAIVKQWADHRRARETAFERHTVDAVKKLASPANSNQSAKLEAREVRFKTVNGLELMLIDSSTFDGYVVGHLDKARVLATLRKRRLLVTNGDGAQYQVRINGDQARFYAIDAAALRAL